LIAIFVRSWRNNLNQVTQVTRYVQPDWGYFEWTEQIISINPYKLIQNLFVMILKNIFMPHLKKIIWWQWHATPWERRLFLDSVHWQITSTFKPIKTHIKCDSKINLYTCILNEVIVRYSSLQPFTREHRGRPGLAIMKILCHIFII
jgi:hypothetical protein